MKNKNQQDIERATAAYLAQGGTVTQCTPGDSAAANYRPLTRRESLARRKRWDWAEKCAHRARRSHGA